MNPVPTMPNDAVRRDRPLNQSAASAADASGPMGVKDVEDGPAVDDREMEVHGPPRCPYSSFAVHVGSKTVSRYGVPRSAHTNNTVGRLALPPPPSRVANRLTAANTVPL